MGKNKNYLNFLNNFKELKKCQNNNIFSISTQQICLKSESIDKNRKNLSTKFCKNKLIFQINRFSNFLRIFMGN